MVVPISLILDKAINRIMKEPIVQKYDTTMDAVDNVCQQKSY
jgi:hypothetical protein